MEAIVVVILIAVAGYFFLKHNTERGASTVRAYLYLRSIREGHSVQEANEITHRVNLANCSPVVLNDAKEFVRAVYGGKQASMIEEAKKQGLIMSRSTYSIGTTSRQDIVHAEDWVRPFVLYYVASQMRMVPEGDFPDTVHAILTGREDFAQQSLLVSLQSYLAFAYGRDRKPDDCSNLPKQVRDFLQAELQVLNSPLALKRFVRRMAESETNLAHSESVLDAQVAEIIAKIKGNPEYGSRLRNLMLRTSVEELFNSYHGMPIAAYEHSLHAATASQ